MKEFIPLIAAISGLAAGSVVGYYVRQSIAKKRIGTIEQKLQEKILQAQKEHDRLLAEAKEKSLSLLEEAKREETQLRSSLLKTEQLLLRREDVLDQKIANQERQETDLQQKTEKIKEAKENLEVLRKEALGNLEKISKLSREEAKKELLIGCEKEFELDLMEKTKRLEGEGRDKLNARAKEIITIAIQKFALPQTQEITTTTVSLPSDEIKGKIIGKEGRNIRTLEKLTGVEIVVDETPE